MKRLTLFLALLITGNVSARAPKKDSEPRKPKISIIIPCHYRHSMYLFDLLKAYEQQTELPDEIVIALSEAHLADKEIIKKIDETKWPFSVVIIQSNDKLYAGQNRNSACEHATGDLFITQDADDLPHPQRVEIIKYLFQKKHFDHLGHGFARTKENFAQRYPKKNIPLCWRDPKSAAYKITNGNVAITRNVFEKIKWSEKRRGQDTEFNNAVFAQFKKCLVLKLALYCYYQKNSTAAYTAAG